jgi:hypothetical protein
MLVHKQWISVSSVRPSWNFNYFSPLYARSSTDQSFFPNRESEREEAS